MNFIKRLSFLIPVVFLYSAGFTKGQQIPLSPVSYRIFSPFIFNPAIAGSKDILSFDLVAAWSGKSNSQVLSGDTRITRNGPKYVSSSDAFEFTNIGVGGSIFNYSTGLHHDIGVSGTFSYHYAIDKQKLSFLSAGVSVKGVYNDFSGNTDLGKAAGTTFFPNFDAGLYYYNPTFFAGLSVTNILGTPDDPDSTGIPASRQYFFLAGYKIILSRSLKIVLEPSLIANADESSGQKVSDILEPVIKLYVQDFCVGSYFNDFDKISFFFQYRYPSFYVGAFFQLPKNSPFFKNNMLAEVTLGLNLSSHKLKPAVRNHW
jgi:type IX secretion system PorP/SprF family membrane protein